MSMDWDRASRQYQDHPIYKLVKVQLSEEKLESLDAVEGIETGSKLTPEARERLVLEITIRALALMNLEIADARRDEAARAVEIAKESSSLAEVRAKLICRKNKL